MYLFVCEAVSVCVRMSVHACVFACKHVHIFA